MLRQSLRLRHYGANAYDPGKFRPIVDENYVKPKGGLWTSPVDAQYGWKQWCENENFGDLSAWFDIDFTGTVLVIDTAKDMRKLPWAKVHGIWRPRFQPLMLQGIDAVYLTAQGEQETRLSYRYNLYGWDCESVLVMNPHALIPTPRRISRCAVP